VASSIILAQPTPEGQIPASPSNVVGIPAPWLQQETITGIPNWFLFGVPIVIFYIWGSKRRRR
jgi:hypothetical protein